MPVQRERHSVYKDLLPKNLLCRTYEWTFALACGWPSGICGVFRPNCRCDIVKSKPKSNTQPGPLLLFHLRDHLSFHLHKRFWGKWQQPQVNLNKIGKKADRRYNTEDKQEVIHRGSTNYTAATRFPSTSSAIEPCVVAGWF